MPTHQSATATVSRLSDPLRTPDETGCQLGIKKNTLEMWRTNRRYDLPYVKVGRLVRYRQSAIDAFIASRTVQMSGS